MAQDLIGFPKDDEISLLKQQVALLQEQVNNLKVENASLKKYIFAKRSEKRTKEDAHLENLFDEAELTSTEEEIEVFNVNNNKTPKEKPGRKPISSDIPRERKVFDVPDEVKCCPCCQKLRPLIETIPTEEFTIRPPKMIVKEYQTLKYGACTCEDFQSREDLPQVVEAKAPKRLIPGSIASPELIAEIATNKFCDHLPLYRQEKIFKRLGVEISRQNMSNWTISVAKKCEIITDYMRELALKSRIINMDETTAQVLNEEGRTAENKSYMWVMVGGQDNKKLVLFNYSKTRNQEVPLKLLEGFRGTLITDGYAGYNKAVEEYGLWHSGCNVHARRKFLKVAEATKKKGKAHIGFEFYSKLYDVEIKLRKMNLEPEEFLKKRRELSIPIWQEFRAWLYQMQAIIDMESPLGKAVKYSINQYQKLVRYLKRPDIPMDNNIAENAIRPFCLGRKNWLFSYSPKGAMSSATMYSLIETAKANGVEPKSYLSFLFNEIPNITSETDLESLMPWNTPQKTL
jgi:transposase